MVILDGDGPARPAQAEGQHKQRLRGASAHDDLLGLAAQATRAGQVPGQVGAELIGAGRP